jgi:hypothetical protein
MPNRPTASSVAQDFQGVMNFFTTGGIVPDPPVPSLVAGARRLHKATYSLILWRFRLRRLRDCGRAFVEELASDALQILPQALMGYNKTTKLLNRGLIENAFRHLYFSDHPVEFLKMHRDRKWYVPVSALREYALSHPAFSETEPRFGAVGNLVRLYSELSAGVHGSRVDDLEMRLALRKIVFTERIFASQVRLVEQAAESINFLLSVYHNLQFCGFHVEDRRVILRTMAPRARRTLMELN